MEDKYTKYACMTQICFNSPNVLNECLFNKLMVLY